MYTEIDKCRICGNPNLETIFDLGEQYLTGVFPPIDDDFDLMGPVTLIKCVGVDTCGLVQLKQSYDLDLMYGDNYGYRSGLNSSMVNHLEAKISKIEASIELHSGDIVLDIGANDGTSLKAYQNDKIHKVAVDPTIKKFSQYYPSNIKQIANFFPCEEFSQYLGNKKCKVITSFSMFYDLEDPVTFAKMIAKYLDAHGIWVFEQSYLPSMLGTNSFDTICHEHLEFYALRQLDWILDAAGLKIIDAELNSVNGGSISITAAHKPFIKIDEHNIQKVNQLRDIESKNGINTTEIWESFHARVQTEKYRLIELMSHTKSKGGKIYGLGASTKGNVLLQYYELTSSEITAIFEVNDEKFGCVTPGGKIPIIDERDLERLVNEDDMLLVFPWHFKDFFINSQKFRDYNLTFPLPTVN
jgi:NDP-4-keto-2,6-dideoxyhexose 3-C-methyltransferase